MKKSQIADDLVTLQKQYLEENVVFSSKCFRLTSYNFYFMQFDRRSRTGRCINILFTFGLSCVLTV